MGEWAIAAGTCCSGMLWWDAALVNHATRGLGAQSTVSRAFPCVAIETPTIVSKWYKAGFKAATWGSEQNK